MIINILKYWKSFLFVILLIISFLGGYQYSSYKADSEDLVQLLKQQEIMQQYLARESSTAKIVEEILQTLSFNERVIERERLKIIEKPIYHIQCIDKEGSDIIKRYALGASVKLSEEK